VRADDGRVLLLTGAPGAGKTTVARSIAERLPRAVHLESDLLFHAIAAGYVEPWKPLAHAQNETVMDVVAQAAVGFASGGYPTIVDGILTPGWFLEPVRDGIARSGVAVSLGILRPSFERTVQRREVGRSPVDVSVIRQLWNDFLDLGPLERHVFVNESETADATASKILDAWNDGLLRV
jgi:predicted kinase